MGSALPQPFERVGAEYRSGFGVGGVSVQLAGESDADVALVPSLEPFRIEAGNPDINIRVEWVPHLSPSLGQRFFDSGTTWELHGGQSQDEFHFDFNAAIFGDRAFKRLQIDSRFEQATLQMNRECLANLPRSVEPLGYPLDELLIMHRLTQENAIELHGCGIARPNGEGNLFIGHSGAGKSTTTRLWTSTEEVEVLSDDRIIVRPDATCDGNAGSGPMRMYGTPWHGEAMFASPASAPLSRIFVLEHGHGNVLTRLTKSRAVGELFARSFVPFHRHEYVDNALSFLEQVAESVPCYRYAFEPDQRAVERILNFRD